jgi:hypothetical protein
MTRNEVYSNRFNLLFCPEQLYAQFSPSSHPNRTAVVVAGDCPERG